MCTSTLIKIGYMQSIKMGIFDKSSFVNTGIIEQVFQCTTKMILLAKMIKLWAFHMWFTVSEVTVSEV